MAELRIETDAGELLFEVEGDEGAAAPSTGFAPASPGAEEAAVKAQKMWGPIWSWAKDLAILAKNSDAPPSVIDIEFAVVAKGSASFAVVSGKTEGSVRVRIKWTNAGSS